MKTNIDGGYAHGKRCLQVSKILHIAAEAQALIRDRSNQLVAVYCEDTGASLNFCCRLVRKYEPFELTPLLYPRNNSQMAWIYEKF